MANDLIEKVARALADKHPRYFATWDEINDIGKDMYREKAQAAIDTIRAEIAEPNEAMLDAYWHQAGESKEMRSRTHISERRYWQVMFDASPIGSGKK
ncbi:hypothetical protein ACLBWS_05935 [Brucellaceae bacterium D45D]